MDSVKKGLQLYTLRAEAWKDLYPVLASVREMGYEAVEFCGLFNHDAAEVRKWLDTLGLTAISDHVTYDMLANDLERTISDRKLLGCGFITLGFLEEPRRHYSGSFGETLSGIKAFSEACSKAGLPLAYHNHNFEFTHTDHGNGLEMLLDGAPELRAQFDTGWLALGGQDPVAMLRKYDGRYTSVHLKDFLVSDVPGVYDFCPIGLGVQDYKTIIATAVAGGAKWIIADQDEDARRPMAQAAGLSANYLQSLGY